MKKHVVMGFLLAGALATSGVPGRAAVMAEQETKEVAGSVDNEIGQIRVQIAKLQKRLEDLEQKRTKTAATTEKRDTDPSLCPDLETAHRKAVKENKPLLLWIGQAARVVPGCISVQLKSYKRAHSPGVVIGMPDEDGDVIRVADLEGVPTNQEIKAKAVRPISAPADTSSYAPQASQYVPQPSFGGFNNFGGNFGGGFSGRSGGSC
jgi:hypothetical protein